MLEYKQVK